MHVYTFEKIHTHRKVCMYEDLPTYEFLKMPIAFLIQKSEREAGELSNRRSW